MALQHAIAALQDITGAIPGIKKAPDHAPESIAVSPIALAYPMMGKETAMSAGFRKGIHTIVCELHFNRGNLPVAIEKAVPFLDLFMNAVLRNPTLNGTVSTVVEEIRYTFGFLPWGGIADSTIGFRFEMDVKIQPSIT